VIAARLQRFLESSSKLPVEICIDERVECRVEVPYPKDDGYHHRGTVTHLISTEGCDDVPVTERDDWFKCDFMKRNVGYRRSQ